MYRILKLVAKMSKLFAALLMLEFPIYNYFDGLIKLFSDLYEVKCFKYFKYFNIIVPSVYVFVKVVATYN